MKKLIVLGLAIGALSISSCKKEYTCECTTTDTSGILSTTTSSSTITASKKDAEAACNSTTTVGTLTTTCELK